jgi:hypothetical protein
VLEQNIFGEVFEESNERQMTVQSYVDVDGEEKDIAFK